MANISDPSSSGAITESFTASEKFYYEDASIYFGIDGVLYGVHLSRLTQKFAFFLNFFTRDSKDVATVVQGKTPQTPIQLLFGPRGGRLTHQEFDVACQWVYESSYFYENPSTEDLATLLYVGELYGDSNATKLAEKAFSKFRSPLEPIVRIRHGRALDRFPLAESGYVDLASRADLRLLPQEQVKELGLDVYSTLLHFQAKTDAYRLYLVHPPPASHVPGCKYTGLDYSPCAEQVWMFWSTVTRVLLHPERREHLVTFWSVVEETDRRTLLPCTVATIEAVSASNLFLYEDYLVIEALKEIRKLDGFSSTS
ncbi:hypothetical protein M407DRAFT_29152 [Tulasnella calospora MUT 4182]|uniref:BTB domain-containing protein n=1 Tax=Tulasnella calospora MUT 4182 TaxID=1051891 RepID=A0A0C3QAL8_9AGAM|nr:hypothetical protein M407DRAFT_29152 [Tulasnella calospora MUT 4182]